MLGHLVIFPPFVPWLIDSMDWLYLNLSLSIGGQFRLRRLTLVTRHAPLQRPVNKS